MSVHRNQITAVFLDEERATMDIDRKILPADSDSVAQTKAIESAFMAVPTSESSRSTILTTTFIANSVAQALQS
jgi:hypothetical protein